jgi:hypothetical protein
MTFLNPYALAWSLLVVPLLLLHFWKPRGMQQPVATAMFWREAIPAEAWRARWLRWRGPVSLVVQVAILMLLVLAAAEPVRWAEGMSVESPTATGGLPGLVPGMYGPAIGSWLAAVTLVLVVIEWCLHQRRWTT